ncbi:TetR/AcrR family transcriptional regulator [Pseudonocardia endophytica]|uniref:TetR/AcrR family transcriptional regulator n=1 Tax=Pseudonocardia endophytica TaxID=401976 RepID=UPI0014051E53|nr:TetR/AcrR family transcriptional regulator [Pseudonocardia endophytica]
MLDAATAVFLREGFAGTGMDTVAAEAGVAKQTVYSHFGDKESLFKAVVHAARTAGRPGTEHPPSLGLTEASDLREALVAFGANHLSLTMSPRVAALRRLIIGELDRRPDLRAMWNEGGPAELTARLADEFAALDRAGRLEVPDAGRAADQLISLLSHEANMRSLYGVRELGPDERRDIADRAADMVLRAYRPVSVGGS